jgi:ABC-type phosphate transport system substrate-binding protein
MSQACRKLNGCLTKNDCTIIWVNQLRMKIGLVFGNPETTTGGNALKYFSSVRLDIRRTGSVGGSKEEDPTANEVKVKVIKNKTAPPDREAEFQIKSGKGVDTALDTFNLAVVTGIVQQAEGAIGYVELVYAVQNKLAIASIQNKSGEYIEANTKSLSTAAGGKVVKDMIKNDFKLSITDSKIKGAYPISSFTWLLIHQTMPKNKGDKIVKMLNWSLGKNGQDIAASMHFAPLPPELREAVLSKIKSIQLN